MEKTPMMKRVKVVKNIWNTFPPTIQWRLFHPSVTVRWKTGFMKHRGPRIELMSEGTTGIMHECVGSLFDDWKTITIFSTMTRTRFCLNSFLSHSRIKNQEWWETKKIEPKSKSWTFQSLWVGQGWSPLISPIVDDNSHRSQFLRTVNWGECGEVFNVNFIVRIIQFLWGRCHTQYKKALISAKITNFW